MKPITFIAITGWILFVFVTGMSIRNAQLCSKHDRVDTELLNTVEKYIDNVNEVMSNNDIADVDGSDEMVRLIDIQTKLDSLMNQY